jgi:hypothetical protein
MALDAVVSRSFVVIRADRTAADARSGIDLDVGHGLLQRFADCRGHHDQRIPRAHQAAASLVKRLLLPALLKGQNNGAMPSWKQLSDTEIAAVITYTKNNWSNKTGQIVQPSEVLAARK